MNMTLHEMNITTTELGFSERIYNCCIVLETSFIDNYQLFEYMTRTACLLRSCRREITRGYGS